MPHISGGAPRVSVFARCLLLGHGFDSDHAMKAVDDGHRVERLLQGSLGESTTEFEY